MQEMKDYTKDSRPGTSAGSSVRPMTGAKGRLARISAKYLSMRTLLVSFTSVLLLVVVTVLFVPMLIGWLSSLDGVKQAASLSLDEQVAAHRSLAVAKLAMATQLKLNPSAHIGQMMSVNIPSYVLNSSAALYLLEMGQFMLRFRSPKGDDTATPILGWENPEWGQSMMTVKRILGDNSWGAMYKGSNKTAFFWDVVNNTVATFIPEPKRYIFNLDLYNRPWYTEGIKLAPFKQKWLGVLFSVTPGEYKMAVSLTGLPAPRGLGALAICTTIHDLMVWMSHQRPSPHSLATIVETKTLRIVFASEGVDFPAWENPVYLRANETNQTLVRQAITTWARMPTYPKPATFSLVDPNDGEEIFVDVADVPLDGDDAAAPVFMLVLMTPRSDFLGQVAEAYGKATRTANTTLIIVLAIEAVILVVSLVASALVAVVLSKPLSNMQQHMTAIANLDFDKASFASRTTSFISEVASLQREATHMGEALSHFGKYVPRQVVKHLMRHQLSAKVGVKRMSACLMFLDVANFTATMDAHGPALVIEMLSIMFQAFSRVLEANGAVIDKYIGDAIMAFWGCPDKIDEPVKKACKAITEINEVLDELNQTQLMPQYGIKMSIRIGLHHGEVYAGNVGSLERLNYTVLGNAVNLAARLEPLGKQFGASVLVSDDVRLLAGSDFAFRCLGRIVVRGFKKPVRVHEFFGFETKLDNAGLQKLQEYSRIDKMFMADEESEMDNAVLEEYIVKNPEDVQVAKYLDYHKQEALMEQQGLMH